jgi:glucose-6-phosphate isomerase
MIIQPVPIYFTNNNIIQPPAINTIVANKPAEEIVIADNKIALPQNYKYILNFIAQNDLKVDLKGVDETNIGTDGLNLNNAFQKYDSQLKTSINRLVKDKNTDGEWLKWIDLPSKQIQKAYQIQQFAENNVRNKFDDVVVLGIGGSSLGPKAVINALVDSQWNLMNKEQRNGYPRIHFIENIDPDRFSETMDKLNLKNTLILTISKSGKTPETAATFLNVQERFKNAAEQGIITKDEIKNHFVVVTDKNPEKSILKQEAIEQGYQTYEVPDDVGGRYSVFSDVGLVPAAMVGVDIIELLRGATTMSKICSKTDNLKENPAANQALTQYLMYQKGKEYSALVPYSDKLSLVSDWYAQLWAESLGKKENKDGQIVNTNYSPIKAGGTVDQHSQLQLWREGKNDKVFTFITVKNFNKNVPVIKEAANAPESLKYMRYNSINELMDIELNATKQVLQQDKRPIINIEMPKVNAYELGQLMQMFMFQTAIVGELQGLGRNTFLQPAVEEGKRLTKENMQKLSDQKRPK